MPARVDIRGKLIIFDNEHLKLTGDFKRNKMAQNPSAYTYVWSLCLQIKCFASVRGHTAVTENGTTDWHLTEHKILIC